MSESARENGRDPGRNRLARTVFSLLPAAMILGLLAPDLVETQLVSAGTRVAPAAPQRMAWQPQHFKSPLLVPADLLVDHGIDLVEISGLVERVARAFEGNEESVAPPVSDAAYEELIVAQAPEDEPFVDEQDFVEEEIFRNLVEEPALTVDLRPAWPSFADVIEWDVYGLGAGFSLFVDFAGPEGAVASRPPAAPVPEPGTGVLLALGLLGLALHRRSRARA